MAYNQASGVRANYRPLERSTESGYEAGLTFIGFEQDQSTQDSPRSAQSGGYEYEFIETVPQKYKCSTICTKVLRDPHLTACCGQHFCESCLQQWCRSQGRQMCPHCRAQGRQFIHILNKLHKREIDEFKIYCTNCKDGCDWIGELGTLTTHLESDEGCGYYEVGCTNCCGEQLKRKELADHLTQHCPRRNYICEYCGEEDTFETITEEHYGECPSYPLNCPNKCGAKGIKRAEMGQHRSKCPLESIECSNKCQKELKRKDLEDHLNQHCPKREYICEYCGEEDSFETITEEHSVKCPNYPLDCPNKCGVTPIKRVEMDEHQSQCPLEPVKCPFQDAGCLAVLVRKEFDSHMTVNQQQHLLTLMGAFREAKDELRVVKTELGTAKAELGTTKKELGAVKDDLSKTKTQLEATQEAMETTQEVIATDVMIMHQSDEKELSHLALASIKTQLEIKSFQLVGDGQPLTFRMTNFLHYQRHGMVWHSPPFYMYCETGYKMQLAVYANGTGAGAGRYMSLTLLLMKGEFDHQIEWPIEFVSGRVITIKIITQKIRETKCIKVQKSTYYGTTSVRKIMSMPTASFTICSQCTPANCTNCVTVDEGARELGSEERFCDHKTVNDALLNDSLLLTTTVEQHYCTVRQLKSSTTDDILFS